MARKSKKKETSTIGAIFATGFLLFIATTEAEINYIYALIGVALLVFLFIAMFYFAFRRLRIKYLDSPTSIRVMDIKKCLPFLGAVFGFFILFVFLPFIILAVEMLWLKYLIGTILAIIYIIGGLISSKHLAVLYLGIVINQEHDRVALPFDMESYTILDYLNFQFISDFCNVDSITLSEIDRLSRGRGVELYIHGSFGSRGLLFSSKQKRDEALSIIKELNASNTKMLSEIESY